MNSGPQYAGNAPPGYQSQPQGGQPGYPPQQQSHPTQPQHPPSQGPPSYREYSTNQNFVVDTN